MGEAYGIAIIVGLLIAVVCAFVLSAAVTGAALVYARRRGMLDQPGPRRSHRIPTPRGGGIGIVVAALAAGLPAFAMLPRTWPSTLLVQLAVAVVAVSAVGWMDDHRPMPVWPRVLVHLIAGTLVAGAILLCPPGDARLLWWLPVVAIAIAGSINAHNFMDGIDGILGWQALFVLSGYGVLAIAWHESGVAGLAFATAAGCLGFLCFNLPPAKIFMGDVGSGTLGLLIGAVAALLLRRDPAVLWACVILPAAFFVDSALTLVRRMLGGQRWYAPHRQHLYQWLVRVRWSHARTDAAYMAWNLVILAPLAGLAAYRPSWGAGCCVAAYLASMVAWWVGKRACLRAAVRQRLVRGHA